MKSSLFSASEIIRFAVKIEENGQALYRKLAERTADARVRKLFLFLADEDARHGKIFAEMLSEVETFEPLESYPGEYVAYMKAYTAEIIFPATVIKEWRGKADRIAALDFGIRRELDSITYYMHIREVVPEGQEKLIDKIIEEERGHFLQFSELKQKYLRKRRHRSQRQRRQRKENRL
jgi:rubrerythrin